ncbi:MAG: multiheme c-type cytochrome [Acidobacteriota bacterium]
MKNPGGGLARRVGYVNAFKKVFSKSPVLYVDAGNFAAVGIPSAQIRNRGMVDGLNQIGYAAVMLGERELAAGYEAFRALAATARFPFVSANFVFEDGGEPIVDPYVVVPADHGDGVIRVAFLGLNRYNTGFIKGTDDGRNVVVTSPFETARRLVPEVREKADVVVVLTSLSISQARQLAKEVEGIDLIIGASGGVLSLDNDTSAGVPIVYPGNQGKYLSEMRLFMGEEGHGVAEVSRRHHYLNREYPVEPALQKLVESVLAQENDMNRERASADVAKVVVPEGRPTFVGSGACGQCHDDIVASWQETGHASAFQTLVERNADFNEECVSCHVVGAGRPGGFVNAKATAGLVNVQCEACHGPGSLHTEAPEREYGAAGARSCLGCHDPTNSPGFDFYTYWPKIKH